MAFGDDAGSGEEGTQGSQDRCQPCTRRLAGLSFLGDDRSPDRSQRSGDRGQHSRGPERSQKHRPVASLEAGAGHAGLTSPQRLASQSLPGHSSGDLPPVDLGFRVRQCIGMSFAPHFEPYFEPCLRAAL